MSGKKSQAKSPQKAPIPVAETSTPDWVYLIGVLLLTFFVFSPTLKNYFIINWDDDGYIINNPMLKEFSWDSVVYMFTHFHLDNYHPLTTFANAVEYHLFKLNPRPYHFFNLLLHLINTSLVFYFIRQVLKSEKAALIVALLFAIHPMHVESVAWLSERKDLLYTAFFMGALIVYNRFLQDENNIKLLYASAGLMLLSCLSKSAAVALTPVLFLLDFYTGKKINLTSVIQKLPFIALSLLFGVLALMSQGQSGSMNMVTGFSLFDKLFLASYGLAYYLIKLLVPLNLSSMHLYPVKVDGILPTEYYLAPLLLIALLVLVFKAKKLQNELIFGFLFYLFTVAMVIQVVPVGKAIVAERYTYVPYIGLFFIIAKFYQMMSDNEFQNSGSLKNIFTGTIAVLSLFYCYQSYSRTKDWKDSYTLFSSCIKNNPDSYYGYFARGVGRTLMNDPNGAISDYTAAAQCDSSNADIWYNRGVELEKVNKHKDAFSDYSMAIKVDSLYDKAYYNRGNIYFMFKEYNNAIKDYSYAARLRPDHAEAYCNRAIANLNLKDTVNAMNDFTEALKHKPTLVNALVTRGSLYLIKNNKTAACADFQVAAQQGSENAKQYIQYYCN